MLTRVSALAATLLVTGLISSAISVAEERSAQPKSLDSDYIVGSWTAEGQVHAKTVKGTMQVRPGAGGLCLIFNWNLRTAGEEPIRGTAVGGLDPKSNQFCEYCFESDGSHFISRYPANDIADVGVGYGERTGTVRGKEYKGKITVDRKGRDHFVYTVASGSSEDVKLIFRRAEEGKAKPKKTAK